MKNVRPFLIVLVLAVAGAAGADDPFDDLVVGIPWEGDPPGAVAVIRGSDAGLTDAGNALWTPSFVPSPSSGTVLAAGDLNGDLLGDVAVGAPYAGRSEAMAEEGMVQICFGGSAAAGGFECQAACIGSQSGSRLGAALALADLNADGYEDLVIGQPLWDDSVNGLTDIGAIGILYGGATVVDDGVLLSYRQGGAVLAGVAEDGDRLGSSLATGDFDGDGVTDLAIGVPNENGMGAVQILYGGSPWATSNVVYTESQLLGATEGEAGDDFAAALAAGDFDGDGYDDLAVGVPGEDFFPASDAEGMVAVFDGGPGGIAPGSAFVLLHQNLMMVAEIAEDYDRFGSTLAAGDFNRDGRDDLVVGVPGEDSNLLQAGAGVVHVFYGSVSGITGNDTVMLQQGGLLADQSEVEDEFGAALAVGDLDRDGYDDLAIGVPGETLAGVSHTGAVTVVYGSPAGISFDGDQLWHQDAGTMQGICEAGDDFGRGLAVLHSRGIFADGFELAVLAAWSASQP